MELNATRIRRVGCLAVVLCALAVPATASAHATVVATTPTNGAVLKHAPRIVTVRFDESVSTPFGALRVLDPSGKRVDDGHVTRPASDSVAVGLPAGLARGTYVVAWRAISADTHPVHGAFTFSVGAASGNAGSVAAKVLAGEGVPRSTSIAFGVVRFFRFLIVLLAAGGALMLAYAAPDLDRLRRPLAIVAAGMVPVAFLGLVYEAATAGGFSVGSSLKWSVLRSVLDTRFGIVWALQAGVAAVVAGLLLARRRWSAAAAAAVLAGLTTEASHAAVDGRLTTVADAVHVIAASAWVGGLAATAVALALASGERWRVAARIVPRFSRIATVAVGIVLAAGILNAYLEVRAWRGLWDTTYGQLVLVKAGLLVPLLGLGLLNNRVSVPRLRLELPSVRRTFVRAAAAELALFAAVLGVTASLVQEAPAKTRIPLGGPFSTTTRLGPYELDATVDPARVGKNVIHLYVLKASGQPAYALEGHAYASLPSAGLGPLRFQGSIAGPGHFVFAGTDFPVAGRWSLRVEVRFGSFDQYDTTLNLPIAKGIP